MKIASQIKSRILQLLTSLLLMQPFISHISAAPLVDYIEGNVSAWVDPGMIQEETLLTLPLPDTAFVLATDSGEFGTISSSGSSNISLNDNEFLLTFSAAISTPAGMRAHSGLGGTILFNLDSNYSVNFSVATNPSLSPGSYMLVGGLDPNGVSTDGLLYNESDPQPANQTFVFGPGPVTLTIITTYYIDGSSPTPTSLNGDFQVSASFTAVPEPSTAVLLIGGGAAVFAFLRRRTK